MSGLPADEILRPTTRRIGVHDGDRFDPPAGGFAAPAIEETAPRQTGFRPVDRSGHVWLHASDTRVSEATARGGKLFGMGNAVFDVAALQAAAKDKPEIRVDPKQFAHALKDVEIDPERAERTNLDDPVLLAEKPHGGVALVDGYHRAHKALGKGRMLKGQVLTSGELRAAQLTEAADSVAKAMSPKKGLEKTPGDSDNWVERFGVGAKGGKGGSLPPYIEHVALAIHRKRGLPKQQAIQIAIGKIEDWAAGRGNVDEGTRAAAKIALEQWEAMKARAHAADVREASAVELVEADWTEDLHPRDLLGQFTRKVGRLKKGESAELPDGTRVSNMGPSRISGAYKVEEKVDGEYGYDPGAFFTNDPQNAARIAATKSARSSDPKSLGGPVSYMNLSALPRKADTEDVTSQLNGVLGITPENVRRGRAARVRRQTAARNVDSLDVGGKFEHDGATIKRAADRGQAKEFEVSHPGGRKTVVSRAESAVIAAETLARTAAPATRGERRSAASERPVGGPKPKVVPAVYVTLGKNGPRYHEFQRGRLWPLKAADAEASFAAGATVYRKKAGTSIWQDEPQIIHPREALTDNQVDERLIEGACELLEATSGRARTRGPSEDDPDFDWRRHGNGKRGVILADGSRAIVDGSTFDRLARQGKLDLDKTPALKGDGEAGAAARRRAGAPASGPGRERTAAPDEQPKDGDFERLHPRGGKGSTTGGKFVKKGSSGDDVRGVQRKVGVDPDGKFGDQTRRAVMRFQAKNGLTVDGVVGKQTASALLGNRDAGKVNIGRLRGDQARRLAERGNSVRAREADATVDNNIDADATIIEADFESLHPRDHMGRWRHKIAALKVGDALRLGNVTVHRAPDTDLTRGGVERTVRQFHIRHDAPGGARRHSEETHADAARAFLDASARDTHPDAIGGARPFRSLHHLEAERVKKTRTREGQSGSGDAAAAELREDAPQPISVGQRVRACGEHLELGRYGTAIAEHTDGSGAFVYDVAWDDGTTTSRARQFDLRALVEAGGDYLVALRTRFGGYDQVSAQPVPEGGSVLDRVAELLDAALADRRPDPSSTSSSRWADLMRVYAHLVLTTGEETADEDVHDAWAYWRAMDDPDHAAIVPFSALDEATQVLDRPYRDAIRAVAKQVRKSAMVALYPSPAVAERLAVEDGLPASELHVTLAYLGKGPWTTEQLDRVRQSLSRLAGNHTAGPLVGKVGGVTLFTEGDDAPVTVLSVDAPGLVALRQRLVDRLPPDAAASTQHDFHAHLSIAYADLLSVGYRPPSGVELRFDELVLVVGDRRWTFPLAVSPASSAADGNIVEAALAAVGLREGFDEDDVERWPRGDRRGGQFRGDGPDRPGRSPDPR